MTTTAILHRLKLTGVAFYLPFLVAISLPINIYLGNLSEMSYPLTDMLPILLSVFFGLAFLIALPLAIPGAQFKRVYLAIIVALSVIAWVESSFVTGDYGLFNGDALSIDDRSPSAWLEVMCCAGLVLLLIASTKLTTMLVDLVLGLFLLTLCLDGYQLLSRNADSPWSSLMSAMSLEQLDDQVFAQLGQFSDQANIVHILLDELQSDVFDQVLQHNPDLRAALDGFTYFPDTSSIYPYTEMSLPGILSGEIYDNKSDKSAYLERAINDSPFLQSLDAAAYSTDFHIHPAYCKPAYQLACTSVPGSSIKPSTLNLVDLGLFRVVPTMLKQTAHNDGMGVFKAGLSNTSYLASQPGIGYVLFNRFNEGFSVGTIPPSYKFFQTLVTHSPQVLQSDCRLSNKNNPMQMPYMKNQSNCAMKLVLDFLANLKQSKIYDKTLVVISSDHGGNYLDHKQSEALAKRSIPEKHFARGKSTLLIKPFNTRGSLAENDYRAQLSDLAATITALADMDYAGHGDNIYDREPSASRVREFYFIDWLFGAKRSERLSGFKRYRINGDVRKASSWKKISPQESTDK